jgi:cell division protein FtsB
MLSKTVKKPTTKPARAAGRRTLDTLSREVVRLRARVEDLEDLRELNEAIALNAGKPGTPWEQVKNKLGL